MIVVDTSAWIDYVNGIDAPHTKNIDYALENERVIIGDIILAEFLQGFRNQKDYEQAKEMMELLEYRDFLGKENAIKAADNYRVLRKQGRTIRKTIDVLIGTFCLENNCKLIHNDKDFDPMEEVLGLEIFN